MDGILYLERFIRFCHSVSLLHLKKKNTLLQYCGKTIEEEFLEISKACARASDIAGINFAQYSQTDKKAFFAPSVWPSNRTTVFVIITSPMQPPFDKEGDKGS